MPPITHDGQCFTINSKRRWIVSGSLDYAQIPRNDWPRALRAARQIGLNTVTVRAPWALHEPTQGKFDFKDNLDVSSFIAHIADAGLMCILRPGPYVGEPYDMGALPPWLLRKPDMQLRAGAPAFLQASSKWITQLMRRVRDQQATSAPPGPIILIQVEHAWSCGDDETAIKYLAELGRFLRETGASVPLINSNNLHPFIEGEIDGWIADHNLHTTARQLREVRPDTPRLITDIRLTSRAQWDNPGKKSDPDLALRTLASALAAGAQFNINPFHAGTSFGFSSGRAPGIDPGFFKASPEPNAPLSQSYEPADTHAHIRRLCLFASSFERVFTALEPDYQPVVVNPDAAAGPSAIHSRGLQGSVTFVFAGTLAPKQSRRAPVTLTLSDGSSQSIDLSSQSVVWQLAGVSLGGRARLDSCNLSPLTHQDKVFVCFGTPGAHASIQINSARLETSVPTGKTPLIEHLEGITVVICNETQADALHIAPGAIYIGAGALTEDNQPVSHPSFGRCTRIDTETGESSTLTPAQPKKLPRAPTISTWERADTDPFTSGSSERFATIDGPSSLEQLGAPLGYGWIRIQLRLPTTKKTTAAFLESSDRLALFVNNAPAALIGDGPGATERITQLPLKKGDNTIVALCDNLGRWSSGCTLGAPTGLFGHILETKPLNTGAHKARTSPPIDPLSFRSPLWGVHAGEHTHPDRPTWTFTHRKKTPIAMVFDTPSAPTDLNPGSLRGLILFNDTPIGIFGESEGQRRIILPEEHMKRGENTVQLALFTHNPKDDITARTVRFYEGITTPSEKATWAFAAWEPPQRSAFSPAIPKGSTSKKIQHAGAPTWWRASFPTGATPSNLVFDAKGLSKGQLYLNSRNAGRYFATTPDGKRVDAHPSLLLPESWLSPSGANELLIFDEHGAPPTSTRLHRA